MRRLTQAVVLVTCAIGSACATVRPSFAEFVAGQSYGGQPLRSTQAQLEELMKLESCKNDPSFLVSTFESSQEPREGDPQLCTKTATVRDGDTVVGVVLWLNDASARAIESRAPKSGRLLSISPYYGGVYETATPHFYALGRGSSLNLGWVHVFDEERLWRLAVRGPTPEQLEAGAQTLAQLAEAAQVLGSAARSPEEKAILGRVRARKAALERLEKDARFELLAKDIAAPAVEAPWLEHARYLVARADAGVPASTQKTADALVAFNAAVERQLPRLREGRDPAPAAALTAFQRELNQVFDCTKRCSEAPFPLNAPQRARWLNAAALAVGQSDDPLSHAVHALLGEPAVLAGELQVDTSALPLAVSLVEAEAKRQEKAGHLLAAVSLWRLAKRGSPAGPAPGSGAGKGRAESDETIRRLMEQVCNDLLPPVSGSRGEPLTPQVARYLKDQPCDPDKVQPTSKPVFLSLTGLDVRWTGSISRIETREVSSTSTQQVATGNRAARNAQESALLQRIQQVWQAREQAQQRIAQARKNVVGEHMVQTWAGDFGLTQMRTQGQQTAQGQADEAAAIRQERALALEMAELSAKYDALRGTAAGPERVSVTQVNTQKYGVEVQYIEGTATAKVSLSDGSVTIEKPVKLVSTVAGGSRSSGAPGVPAWSDLMSPDALRERATEVFRQFLFIDGAKSLLRAMLQERIEGMLRAQGVAEGSPLKPMMQSLLVLKAADQ